MEKTEIIDDISGAENLTITDEMDLKDDNQEPEIEDYPEEIEEFDNEDLPKMPITHDEEEAIEGTLEEE